MLRGGRREPTGKRHKEMFWGDGIILDLILGVGYVDVYNCQNSLNTEGL